MSSNAVKKFYLDVVEQLFEQSRTFWDEEGLDESSMVDLRQLWETKLGESGIDLNKDLSGAADEERTATTSKSSRAAGGNRARNASATSNPSMMPSTSKAPQYQAGPSQSLLQQPQYMQHSQLSHGQHHLMTNQNAQNSAMSMNQSSFSNSIHSQSNESNPGSIRLIPFNVPISGPVVQISPQGVPTSSTMHRQPLSAQSHLNQQPPMVSAVELQRMFSNNPQDGSGHVQAMDRLSQRGLSGNDQQHQRSWNPRPLGHNMQQQAMTAQQVALMQAQAMKNQGRQTNAPGGSHQNQVNQPGMVSQNQNHTGFPTGHQMNFHQPGVAGSSHASVIHVMDRSGNQSALPVGNGNIVSSAESLGNAGGFSTQLAPNNARKPGHPVAVQLDGLDDDNNFEDLSDDDNDSNIRSVGHVAKKVKTSLKTSSERLEESDLDSEDDDDDEPANVEMVDNVVVCQYEKISRTRNKWKFHLKSGMCSLNGKEFIFHKAVGDAEF